MKTFAPSWNALIAFPVVLVGVLVVSCHIARAQSWADLTMTVRLDGEAPKANVIPLPAFALCGRRILSEDLVVDPKTKGIANIVFMIDARSTKLEPDQIHPDTTNPIDDKPVLDIVNCTFVPHIIAMQVGQTLISKNSDKEAHNAKFNFFENQEESPYVPVGKSREIKTTVAERTPIRVDCNVHPWMRAFVIVTSHPYVGISDAEGKIKIENLPAETELTFKLWHESQDKSIERLSLDGKDVLWKKGLVTLVLKPGANDLGVLLIDRDRFKKQ